jgi:RNA polymerase sigma-70 factor (ECF subfamily)
MYQTMFAAPEIPAAERAAIAPVLASARIYAMHEARPTVPASIDLVQLYGKHRAHLMRFVQRYLGNQGDAEDVVQNTFVEALRCADQFSGLSKPSTWLFGIALNLARNQVRRNCADRYDDTDEGFMEQIVDIHADPALQYELRQMAGLVDTLLGELPAAMRNTFEAVLDGEMSYEKAARELNIPIGTVRSRVSRVRAAARRECGRD